jgi:hypothetical protein
MVRISANVAENIKLNVSRTRAGIVMNRFHGRLVKPSLTALLVSSAAAAGGNTPILDERAALRSVLSGQATAISAPSHADQMTIAARSIVKDALDRLATVTTPAALAATPGGLELPCAISGTLRARMSALWPRMVKLEWVACASAPFGAVVTSEGPGEVVLPGNSFAPAAILSLRLGDRTRDLVVDAPVLDSLSTGGSRTRSNLRITGSLPFAERDQSQTFFLGRFAYEMTGFHEVTSFIRDRPNPGPPFYPHVQTYVAQNLIALGETLGSDTSLRRQTRLLTGVISWRNDRPVTPTRPGGTAMESFRFQDLRTTFTNDYSTGISRLSYTIDGRAEVNLAQTLLFPGCTQPETYVWRTVAPLRSEATLGDLLEAGELAVNGRLTAQYRVTGIDPFVDMLGHIDLQATGLGAFTFSAPFSLFDLTAQAGCSP